MFRYKIQQRLFTLYNPFRTDYCIPPRNLLSLRSLFSGLQFHYFSSSSTVTIRSSSTLPPASRHTRTTSSMPSPVVAGINVVELPGLTIKEFHGGVSTNDTQLSAVHEVITKPSTDQPWRCPEFDEYILVTKGEAQIEYSTTTKSQQEEEKAPEKEEENCSFVVQAESGVFLPKGCRVRVTFPTGPAEVVAICLPAFSPLLEHAETEKNEGIIKQPHGTSNIPEHVRSVDVVKAPTLTITEYFGNVAVCNKEGNATKEGAGGSNLSACVAKVRAPCSEAWQCPEFAEWVMVLEGTLHLEHTEGTTTVVPAGSGVYLKAHERVKWIWPEPCTYVPICMPAFTPEGCHREPEEGSAKDADPKTMEGLLSLHNK